jgi:hypothetical protein
MILGEIMVGELLDGAFPNGTRYFVLPTKELKKGITLMMVCSRPTHCLTDSQTHSLTVVSCMLSCFFSVRTSYRDLIPNYNVEDIHMSDVSVSVVGHSS